MAHTTKATREALHDCRTPKHSISAALCILLCCGSLVAYLVACPTSIIANSQMGVRGETGGQESAAEATPSPQQGSRRTSGARASSKRKSPTSSAATTAGSEAKSQVERDQVERAASVGRGALPFRVEVTDTLPDATVILAVGAVTLFRCPEPPLQVVIGNLNGIGVAEAVETEGRGDFYLRPTIGGLLTNMFIEMKSGTVQVVLKTVAPKIVRPGDYNGEVYVRAPQHKDEMQRLRERVTALEGDLARAKNARAERSKETEKEVQASIGEAVARERSRIAQVEYEAIEVLGRSLRSVASKNARPIQNSVLRVVVPMPPVRTESGRVWFSFQLSNKSRTAPLRIEEIKFVGVDALIRASGSNRRMIPANGTEDIGMIIEMRSPATQGEVKLLIEAGGQTLEVPVVLPQATTSTFVLNDAALNQ